MKTNIKIKSIEKLTHDVLCIQTERPKDLTYVSGQAADISINKPGFEDKLRAFTFTSLPEDDFLEFSIKTYPSHHGVTEQLLSFKPGDELTIHGVFGDIHYKGEGFFIAGGAGVTPFISIFRSLEKKNEVGNSQLMFANKRMEDIIHNEYFKKLLGKNFINVLSEEKLDGYESGYITEDLIKKHKDSSLKYCYLCGPDPMMEAVEKSLISAGISKENIVRENF